LAFVIDPEILTIVRRYLDVLREENVHYESVWLFGSWAAGRQRPDSDIDVAVVMRHVESLFDRE
jgi:predicted nucleotidyltransferase